MYFENSRAHGTLCTLCPSSDKSDKSDKSDILCPQYRHCAMRSASRQPPQPCAMEFPGHRAPTQPCANRPYKSVQVRTSPYSLARTLCLAQCALPVFRRLESPSGRQPTTSERHVCRPCPQYRHCAMRSASQQTILSAKKNNFCTLQGLFFLRDAVK